MTYQLIRSNRRTLGLQVKAGQVIVRAPLQLSEAYIKAFVEERRDWIQKQQEKYARWQAEQEPVQTLTQEELAALGQRALGIIPQRVRHYAPLVGVQYRRITLRFQRTRWGSCSSKHNLNFNCLLLLAPPEALDAVVVHELCHIKQPSHSRAFYEEVLRVYPDYYRWDAWLKEQGGALLRRLPTGEEDAEA